MSCNSTIGKLSVQDFRDYLKENLPQLMNKPIKESLTKIVNYKTLSITTKISLINFIESCDKFAPSTEMETRVALATIERVKTLVEDIN